MAAPVRISGVRMVTTTDFRNKLAGGTILFMHSRRARRALRPFLILNMEPLSRKVLVHCAPNSRGAYVACEAIRTYSERSLVDGVDGWNTGNGVLSLRLTASFSKSRYDDASAMLHSGGSICLSMVRTNTFCKLDMESPRAGRPRSGGVGMGRMGFHSA